MTLVPIVTVSAVVLLVAYFTYGRLLAHLFRLDSKAITPAVELRDNVDYEPIEPKFLMSQHFSAIAAAGPIVGPILAGVMFGWLPAMLWILIGCVFVGGVHDLAALTASVRHKARSIAEVVRDHMTKRSYLLFLSFVWIALVYIIVAFTDITAQSFVGMRTLDNGQTVTGAGIASSSAMYLMLPIVMGLLLRYTKLSLNMATLIFLPLVGVAIWAGQKLPLDLAGMFNLTDGQAHKLWDVILLGYCLVAAVVPMWMLLQPRGHLGGYFLYAALAGGMFGLLIGGQTIVYPSFTSWSTPQGDLTPFLFITIACGACSGFHSLICSGTTSKQLARETDAKVIGYGAMLLEGMVAIVSLSCVMVLATNDELLKNPRPDLIYALGIGRFLGAFGIPAELGVAFALMAFTTFVYDTLDVCTRLGRYIIQELTGLSGSVGRWLGTSLTAGVPLIFLLQSPVDASGAPVPVWRIFWALFGASNQLLAALTLLGVTVWLWKTRREIWVWFVTGIPTVLMYVMSSWALVNMTIPKFRTSAGWIAPTDPVPWIGLVLLALAAWMMVEAIVVLAGTRTRSEPPAPKPEPEAAVA